jgi:hypothetical protein
VVVLLGLPAMDRIQMIAMAKNVATIRRSDQKWKKKELKN